jgi:hypothetical protein
VSTVLSPVGPERPTIYWLRRGVIIVILLALVLLVAHACSGGKAATPAAAAHHHTASSPSPQPSASAPATGTPRCTAADLSASLTTDRPSYTSGQEPKFTGTFHNTSAAACRLVSDVASRKWTVTSGHDTIWSTAGCQHTGSPTKAKLTPTGKATVSISWDGHRNDPSCTVGSTALPGTYVLRATFGAVTATPVVFHVVP